MNHGDHGGHGGHEHVRVRRAMTAGEMGMHSKAKTPVSVPRAGGVIMEEYSETEPSSEGGEFGVMHADADANPAAAVSTVPAAAAALRPQFAQEGVAVPRPPRAQMAEQAAEKAQARKSFSLFGKKTSLEVSPTPYFTLCLVCYQG